MERDKDVTKDEGWDVERTAALPGVTGDFVTRDATS